MYMYTCTCTVRACIIQGFEVWSVCTHVHVHVYIHVYMYMYMYCTVYSVCLVGADLMNSEQWLRLIPILSVQPRTLTGG